MVNDLTDLEEVNAENIVRLLEQRFIQDGKIYTGLGPSVVMKVNPFDSAVKSLHSGPGEPHVANLARLAREQALTTGRDHSCMMTGESGSGKTEATKVYLNELAGEKYCANKSLQVQLVDSCTLLESFGNCSTEHNHNSSRFARWFELVADRSSGKIVRGVVHQYLLEKARVVKGSETSANFHVLYDICESFGTTIDDPTAVQQRASHFNYLKNRIGKGSLKRYERMETQLTRLGVQASEIAAMERVLWCILHLGNLEFKVDPANDATSILSPDSGHSLRCVSAMLGIDDVQTVSDLFQKKRLKMGREFVTQNRSAAQARDSCDALAKDLYSRLFVWIVSVINKSINPSNLGGGANTVSLGILDIFGFECFESNSFEQVCINYCNEKLVQQFHDVLVRTEIEVCQAEGVPSGAVGMEKEYEKAQKQKMFILNGIDNAFTLIQDETRLGPATDKSLTAKLLKLRLGDDNKLTKIGGGNHFTINHYAGTVTYNVLGFLEKNKDEGPKEIADILVEQSSIPFVASLYNDETPSKKVGGKAARKKALGVQFRDEFQLVAKSLASSEQQFVMCMKPNRQGLPKVFQEQVIMRQLECNGTLTICKVRQSAFASHMPFPAFVEQYRFLTVVDPSKPDDLKAKQMAQEFSRTLFSPNDMFVGKTRVLLRQDARKALDKALVEKGSSAKVIQAFGRMIVQRTKYNKLVAALKIAATKMQSIARMYLACLQRLVLHEQKQKSTRATRIQTLVRMFLAKCTLSRLRAYSKMKKMEFNSAVIVQSAFRCHIAFINFQRKIALIRWRKRKDAAVRCIQRAARTWLLAIRQRRMAVYEEKAKARRAAALAGMAATAAVAGTAATAAVAGMAATASKPNEYEQKAHARRAAAMAGLAATQASRVKNVSPPGTAMAGLAATQASRVKNVPPPATSNLENNAVMSRPTIQGRRRRPTRMASKMPPAVGAGVVVATRVDSSKKLEESIEQPQDDDLPDFEQLQSRMAAVTIQRFVKDCLSRRAKLKRAKTKPVMRKRTSSYFFNKKSAAFVQRYGKTEEEYYEAQARQIPSFNYLIVETPAAAQSPRKRHMRTQSGQVAIQHTLADALKAREFSRLTNALKQAYDAGFYGDDVEKVEAAISHIRKTHLKQLEAERVLAAKYGW